MDIYYLNLHNVDKDLLKSVSSRTDMLIRENKIELKFLQHLAGRFLLDYVAKKIYCVEDTALILRNGKPVFENSPLNFSISHSENIVTLMISEFPIGIDIEYNVRERDFVKLVSRFNKVMGEKFQGLSSEQQKKEFYQFWTQYEAKIKLGNVNSEVFLYSTVLDNDFTLGIATTSSISDFCMKKWGEF